VPHVVLSDHYLDRVPLQKLHRATAAARFEETPTGPVEYVMQQQTVARELANQQGRDGTLRDAVLHAHDSFQIAGGVAQAGSGEVVSGSLFEQLTRRWRESQ
jgi:hypothetical protein